MTHSDDDGLVIPPKLAPSHVVILPIYKNDEQRSVVLEYCDQLQKQLKEQTYEGEPIRVIMDDRDIRGGEKKWYHVKRGVPIRVEVGPRDIENGNVFMSRRDTGESNGVSRDEFVTQVGTILTEIQSSLFDQALKLREDNSRTIDTLDEFREYFTPEDKDALEIHGGFASSHFCEDAPEVQKVLGELKVTTRCIPLDQQQEPGTCIFSGKPSTGCAVFGKSY